MQDTKKASWLSYFFFIFLATMIGVSVSVYLSISHYRNYMDIGYQSFCAISQAVNCDTVAQSPYAVFWNVPLGVWGLAGYFVFFGFMVLFRPWKNKSSMQAWAGGALVLTAVFSVISLLLAAIAIFKIHSHCLMCIVLYGVNFSLFYACWLLWRRSASTNMTERLKNQILFFRENISRFFLLGAGFLVISGVLVVFYPKYWQFPTLSNDSAAMVRFGITDDGSPWIGAENPVLTIEEYADYMCFQCGKMHTHLRQLVNRYPDKIRLVHRHFPLDDTINPVVKENVHPNSGLISLFAIMAQDAGLFWPVNDLLFRDAREKGVIQLGDIGKQVHLDMTRFEKKITNKAYIEKLGKDIQEGLRLGITATPSYVIDGKVYAGNIPGPILDQAVSKK